MSADDAVKLGGAPRAASHVAPAPRPRARSSSSARCALSNFFTILRSAMVESRAQFESDAASCVTRDGTRRTLFDLRVRSHVPSNGLARARHSRAWAANAESSVSTHFAR